MKTKTLWKNILSRTNPDSAESKRFPKYVGTKNLFGSIEELEEWCFGSEGFGLPDSTGKAYALDKDLAILAGDINFKAYGPHCVFLPAKLNSVVQIEKGKLGQLAGVTPYTRGRWRMQYRDFEGVKHHGGIYNTEQQAHEAWKVKKSETFEQASRYALGIGLIKAARMFKQASDKIKE